VVVPPRLRIPVVVGSLSDLDRDEPLAGPARIIGLKPGWRARPQVVIARRCDGARAEMTTTTAAFSAYGRSASPVIPACGREGAQIDAGPFLRGP
jgi:hypothetical protein